MARQTISLRIQSGANRVSVAKPIGTIALHAVRDISFVGLLRDAVVQQVPERIGREVEARVAGDQGGLHAQVALRVLQADGAEVGNLALVFIEQRTGEGCLAIDREPESRLQPVLVGYLEPVVRASGN